MRKIGHHFVLALRGGVDGGFRCLTLIGGLGIHLLVRYWGGALLWVATQLYGAIFGVVCVCGRGLGLVVFHFLVRLRSSIRYIGPGGVYAFWALALYRFGTVVTVAG